MYKNKNDLIYAVIEPTETVLDVGFAGQAIKSLDSNYPHRVVKERAKETWGVDIYLPEGFTAPNYIKVDAESFSLERQFDSIVAFDVIEHLSNPGLFLTQCSKHTSRLVLTTPNAFSFFSIIEKITHDEPKVNKDHTCYFNKKTITVLLHKNGWKVERFDYVYDILGNISEGGLKRKLMALIYKTLSYVTPKFLQTLVIVACTA